MTTATLVPQSPQTSAAQVESNITAERTEYAIGYKTVEKDGQYLKGEPSLEPVDTEEKVQYVKKLVEEKKFIPAFTLTVQIPRAKNLAGIHEICPDEEEAAANFNRGAKQKANNRLKANLLDVDADGNLKFDPAGVDKEGKPNLTNGVLDMTAEIASPSKRQVLTEEEKLDRFLEQFPESTRNMMKQAYLASRQAPVAA